MENEDIIQDLRKKYDPKENVNIFAVKFDAPKKEAVKPSFYSYSADTQDMAYQTLSDGSKVAKYESYVPGVDNGERLAREQSTGDKWVNGLGKFFGKTGTAVLGGTVGTVNGIAEAIKQGSFDALYDNDFSRKLDDLNVKMDYQLPNYYTKQERDKGFISSMGDANFWANDVLSGLSFTVGAIISEGIWAGATGGTSLAATGAKWGMRTLGEAGVRSGLKALKGTGNTLLKVGAVDVSRAITAGKIGAGANAVRFAVTSTGYEAGVEALQFKKEAEENFQEDFQKLNGRAPNQEDYIAFQENLKGAANGVFALNTAILIPSNLAMFGQNVMTNLPSPFKGVTKSINKSLYGIGTKVEGGAVKVLDPTKFQRIARKATILGKPAITEGLYEEGMQSVATNLMGKYLEASYNPKYTENSLNMFDAVYDSFADTYGTKEGWKEIGIGMLIGGGTSLIMGQGANEFKQLDKAQTDYAEYTNTYQQMSLRQKGIMSNQIQTAIANSKTAIERNDRVGANLASNEAIIAQMDYKFSVGENLSDLSSEYADALNKMTKEEFKEIGVEESEIQQYKDSVIGAHKSLTDRYSKNRTFADLFVGSSNVSGMDTQAFAKGLAFAMTQGENSNILMSDIVENLSEKIGVENTASIKAEEKLRQAGAEVTQEVQQTVKEVKDLQSRSTELEKLIRKIQARPKTVGEVKGNQTAGNEYFDVAEQLLAVQGELTQKQVKLDDLVSRVNTEINKKQGIAGINLEGNIVTDTVSSEVFMNLEENIKKTDALIESYRTSNPQAFAELAELTRQYKKAQNSFEGYQTMANQMMSGKLNFKSTNTWIGKALSKGKTLDEFTTDFFTGIKNSTEEAQRALEEFQVVDTMEEVVDPNQPVAGGQVTAEEVVTVSPTLSPLEQLKERIKNGIKGRFNSIEYIGQTADELLIKKPTQKDVDRFQKLLKERVPMQEEEFQALKEKFADWRMVDSAYENEGETLADLIELVEQLETAEEVAETKTEVTEGDIQDITEEDKATGNIVADEIGQRSVAPATAQRTIKGEIKFSHLKIDTFLNRLGMPYEVEFPKGEKNPEAMGVKYKLSGETPITITMGEGGTILMKEKDYFANMEALNLRILRTAQEQVTWSYFDVYEWNGVATVPKTSEFFGDDLQGDSYNLDVETPLELYLDLEHPYNKTLIEEYNKSKKEDKHKKKIMSQLVIYIRKDGKNYSTLKSLRAKSTDPKMQLIREASFQAMLNGTSTVVGETKLDKMFMGTPKFSLTQEGRLNIFDFNDKSVKEVVTTGYILNGELTLADKSLTEVKRSFVSKLSGKNKGSKIPVVVVKKGKYLVAYPITLSKTSASKESELDVILNSPISDVEKVKAVNKLLLENQVLPSKFNLTSLDDTILEQIREEMKNHTTTQSVDAMAETSYKKEQLKDDATIQIDLEDLSNSISSPKISIDLAGAIVRTTNDFKNDNLTELENDLSEEVIRINGLLASKNGVSGYADKNGDPIEDKFREVFDDNEVNKSPQDQLQKMKNLNILSEAMKNLTKSAKEFLGADTIKSIQTKLKQLEIVKKQLSTKNVVNNVAC